MADDTFVPLPLPVGFKLGFKTINNEAVFASVMVDENGNDATAAIVAALAEPGLAINAATDAKLEAVRELLAAPLASVAIDPSTNIAIPNTPSVFVTASDAQGNLADGPVVSGSGANTNDVLVSLISASGQTLVFDITTPNSSYSLVAETTLDGVTWESVPVVNISINTSSPSYTGIQAKAGRWAAPVAGGLLTRVRVSAAGTGSAVVISARIIGRSLVDPTALRDAAFKCAGSIAYRVGVSGRLLTGYNLFNTAASVRYAQFCDSPLNPPIAGTASLLTVQIQPGASEKLAGLKLGVNSGLGIYFSTDYAGITASGVNEVLGTVLYT